MLKKVAVVTLLSFVCFIYLSSQTPKFLDGNGYYGVTVGKGSSGRTEFFSTDEKYRFYRFSNISGQSLLTEDKNYVDNFLKDRDCKILFTETVDGIVLKYYYTPKISGYRSINGKKVNVQTAEKDGKFTLGTPLIYGGY